MFLITALCSSFRTAKKPCRNCVAFWT